MYELLLYAHIVSGVIWVGGAVAIQALAFRVARSDDPGEVPRIARHMEAMGMWLFMPAALVILITGTLMTVQAWSFSQPWIAIAIALWVLSAVAGATYLGPRAKRAAALFDAEGPSSRRSPRADRPAVHRLSARAGQLRGHHRPHGFQAGRLTIPPPRSTVDGSRDEAVEPCRRVARRPTGRSRDAARQPSGSSSHEPSDVGCNAVPARSERPAAESTESHAARRRHRRGRYPDCAAG